MFALTSCFSRWLGVDVLANSSLLWLECFSLYGNQHQTPSCHQVSWQPDCPLLLLYADLLSPFLPDLLWVLNPHTLYYVQNLFRLLTLLGICLIPLLSFFCIVLRINLSFSYWLFWVLICYFLVLSLCDGILNMRCWCFLYICNLLLYPSGSSALGWQIS